MASFDHYPDYEWTRPLPAEGGIQARSRRGEIGETWWSRRFIELLESFGVGSRLQRGRNYARSGQVTELDVEHGVVLAKVQGSRHTPYRVRIRFKALTENQWRRAEKAMAAQVLPLAKLLAGEMPHDIEELLEECKLTLFPRSASELAATCTCPDGANPCKHIAAAYYILAERFDEDPFLIFTWRGRDQDELVESLRKRRAPTGRGAKTSTTSSAEDSNVSEPSVPLSAVLDSFWACGPELDAFHVSPLAGEAPDALLRQLGPAPVEVGDRNLTDVLAGVYVTLAQAAERRALGE
ncbi:MAG TPA: SWIM zinc finger family protein [Solirubrobacteraceae bacterium]